MQVYKMTILERYAELWSKDRNGYYGLNNEEQNEFDKLTKQIERAINVFDKLQTKINQLKPFHTNVRFSNEDVVELLELIIK